jgi:DNA-binding transcriptional MerR regulator
MSKELMTRNDVRKLGVEVTNTTFQRWEKAELLTPIKPNGRASRVYYKREQVERLISTR